ncbi:pilus assembly protein [Microbacterium sp. EYE_5]|uniref:TadE family type IV pilus minor pilin n=1 Tax=unclassified Microbacterium TaxID=2609290 RepID=UPI0020049F60|nr:MULTISPECIES: TadE family type IV pilus minor pilin [unclassified Microbacterium]MCK6080345.1 pilus assembly protein [Microbacterium sp. EYE_382]MCK6085616.1 pilus assembly protein [Microbacterium sp. EYE_384]MCK6122159.1 pilus assembly protein [Microbacterium sp. EYE_80]MCK6126379.1 pilus assembly protein [Microbacterium sp. EYE_79]MCK6141300.1 pilus assembly protein [Microbacterium sp. EYE_39]
MRSDERGSVAAEFAVTLPAVVLVIVLAVSALSVGGRHVRLEQAASQAARLAAREESADRVRDVAGAIAPGSAVSTRRDGDVVCVDLRTDAGVPLPLPPLRASSCALAAPEEP